MTAYQEIRTAGMSAVPKLLKSTHAAEINPARVAKRMTLPMAGRTLVFHDEPSQNAFTDFWLHEYRVNGHSLVEAADAASLGCTPLEAEVIEAMRRSRTSLFAVEGVVPAEHQLRLRDLLEPDQPEIRLTDMGFSQSIAQLPIAVVFFCRLVLVRGICMSSGFSFLFTADRAPGLLQAYRQKMKKVPPSELPEQRFVFFFRKHRQLGEAQRYEDVV